MDGMIGVITPVAYNFAPDGWALCNGQSLPIKGNEALFAVIGLSYGGDGLTSFDLPNLCGAAPVGANQSGSNQILAINVGLLRGQVYTRMDSTNLPSHTHEGPVWISIGASSQGGETPSVENATMGGSSNNTFSSNADTTFGAPTLTGGIQAAGLEYTEFFNSLMPYLPINYIICISGIYPSRG